MLLVFVSHEIVKILVLKIHLSYAFAVLPDPIHDPNVIFFYNFLCYIFVCVIGMHISSLFTLVLF